MTRLNQYLLTLVAGLAVSVVLGEALMRLLQFLLEQDPLLSRLAAGTLDSGRALVVLGLIWLLAAAAGAAMTVALSGSSFLGLPVGLACSLPLGFTALVGMQPVAWSVALGLIPLLGALLATRLVQHLQRLDQDQPVDIVHDPAGL